MRTILNIKNRTGSGSKQRHLAGLAVILGAALLVAGCGDAKPSSTDGSTKVRVVAAENFWGSLTSQLGGDRIEVHNIIDNPDADPHDYEPTTADGRAIAQAQLVILNGAGYDPWAQNLLDANADADRAVLNVGELVNAKEGANPHLWYSPRNVDAVIDAITAKLKEVSPSNASYFDQQHDAFTNTAMSEYKNLRMQIEQRYANTAVGATESIFEPLAADLGLALVTPAAFMNAIGEGEDPTAADKSTADRQITEKEIKVLVFNSQNSTPDVQQLVDKAKRNNIPVVPVTETPASSSVRFQDWQVSQLQALSVALAQSTGK